MKIQIRNYQSIRNVELEPEGFTIIVGDSNIGKSSIVRAIVGLLTNSLDAAAIRKGSTEAAVVMEYGGHQYVVVRDKKTSIFHIDGKEYRKLNRKAHPLIGEQGLRPISASGVELTPQWNEDQFSPLLLLSKAVTPSQAASLITQATRLDVISTAQRDGAGELRTDKISLKGKKTDLESAKSRLSRYEGLKAVADAATGLKAQRETAENVQLEVELLQEIKARAETVDAEKTVLEGLKQVHIPGIPSDKMVNVVQQLKQVSEWSQRLAEEGVIFSLVPGVSVPTLSDLEGRIQDVETFEELTQKWKVVQKEDQSVRLSAKALKTAFQQLEDDESRAREEIGVCPVCGKKL